MRQVQPMLMMLVAFGCDNGRSGAQQREAGHDAGTFGQNSLRRIQLMLRLPGGSGFKQAKAGAAVCVMLAPLTWPEAEVSRKLPSSTAMYRQARVGGLCL